MPLESFWTEVAGDRLAQGDYLTNCPVPVFPSNFEASGGSEAISIRRADLIVVTQSCDLENNKVQLVAMCPILTVAQLKTVDERYGKPDRLEEIRKGRFESLHMLSSPEKPDDNNDVRIVDFREIHSLPMVLLGNSCVKPRESLATASAISGTFLSVIRAILHAGWSALCDSQVQVTIASGPGIVDNLEYDPGKNHEAALHCVRHRRSDFPWRLWLSLARRCRRPEEACCRCRQD
jgi:hypothetical protein